MADDPIQDLKKARAALVAKRLAWAKTIAAPGEISQGAISAIIDVQQAIDVIDLVRMMPSPSRRVSALGTSQRKREACRTL
jgi:hypothetical protein